MNTHFTIDHVKPVSFDKTILELGGPITNTIEHEHTHLFVNSYVSKLGDGDVASNFRNKTDVEFNNRIVKNTYDLIKSTEAPVIMSSYPRTQRYLTFKMEENGSVSVINNQTNCRDANFESIMNNFFKNVTGFSSTEEMLQKMRLSSEGARFNTYLADVISFILQTNWFLHPDMFEQQGLIPVIVNTDITDVEGNPVLKKVVNGGREWIPKKDFNYLYFEDSSFRKIYIPKKDTSPKVYHQMMLLLDNEENGVKEQVRNHIMNTDYIRISDYFQNDVDDAIQMLMIRNCFNYCRPLNSEQESVVAQLDKIIHPWLEELKKN